MTFSSWKKRNYSGPNLDNTHLNMAPLRSPILPWWKWFSSLNVVVFGPVIRPSRVLTPFCSFQASRQRSHLENLSGICDNLHHLWSRFSGWSSWFRLFLCIWCVRMNPCLVTKWFRNSLWKDRTNALVVAWVSKRDIAPTASSYQNFMKDKTDAVSWNSYCSAILRTYIRQSAETSWWIFATL